MELKLLGPILYEQPEITFKYVISNKHLQFEHGRVNPPNSGCLMNIGNRPQSGPSVCNAAKGRKVVLH